MPKQARVIGTTEDAVFRAEREVGRALPGPFRSWLLLHNGMGLDGVAVFPVLDDRDPRKTWDSIVRQYELWKSYCTDALAQDEHPQTLLPFASFGTGDYYCFDYSRVGPEGEPVVVHWSHETGDRSLRGNSFPEFVVKLESGEFAND